MFKNVSRWLCAAWMPLYFSHSSSQANQAQTTDTQDNRIQAAQDSTNLNNSRGVIGGNVNIVQTDHGAIDSAMKLTDGTVSKAFDFASQVTAGAASNNAASIGAVQATATSAVQAVQAAYAGESKTLADAYTTAKAGEQKVLVAAALAVLGVVAVKSFGKHA